MHESCWVESCHWIYDMVLWFVVSFMDKIFFGCEIFFLNFFSYLRFWYRFISMMLQFLQWSKVPKHECVLCSDWNIPRNSYKCTFIFNHPVHFCLSIKTSKKEKKNRKKNFLVSAEMFQWIWTWIWHCFGNIRSAFNSGPEKYFASEKYYTFVKMNQLSNTLCEIVRWPTMRMAHKIVIFKKFFSRFTLVDAKLVLPLCVCVRV